MLRVIAATLFLVTLASASLTIGVVPAAAQDPQTQLIALLKNCQGGSKADCRKARAFADRNYRADSTEMMFTLRVTCEAGDASACQTGFQRFYAPKMSAETDRAVAVMAWHGCLFGTLDLCRPLDDIHDTSTEGRFYRMANACDQGGVVATCVASMRHYRTERGIDNKLTYLLAGHACDKGSAEGCGLLGYIEEKILFDYRSAATFYRLACDGGYSQSCDGAERMEGTLAYRERERDRAEAERQRWAEAEKRRRAEEAWRGNGSGSSGSATTTRRQTNRERERATANQERYKEAQRCSNPTATNC